MTKSFLRMRSDDLAGLPQAIVPIPIIQRGTQMTKPFFRMRSDDLAEEAPIALAIGMVRPTYQVRPSEPDDTRIAEGNRADTYFTRRMENGKVDLCGR